MDSVYGPHEHYIHPDFGTLALGKGPVSDDPRTFRLTDIIDRPTLPPLAPVLDNSGKWVNMGILGNDRYGDCVICMYANFLDLVARLLGGSWTCSTTDVVTLYFQRSGGIDRGLVIVDFLTWAIKNFWLGKKILAFASIDPRNMTLMAQAISLCGAVLRGIALPVTAQGQVGGLWDFLPNVQGNTPGSWGGHATLGVAYDMNTGRTKDCTWGLLQTSTFNFWSHYQTEAYAVITEDTPGIDRDRLEGLLQQLGQYVGPQPNPNPPAPPTPPPPAPPAAGAHFDGKVVDATGKSILFSTDFPTLTDARQFYGTFTYGTKRQSFAVGLSPARTAFGRFFSRLGIAARYIVSG